MQRGTLRCDQEDTRRPLAIATLALTALAACGSDDDGDDRRATAAPRPPTSGSGSTAPTRRRRPATGSRRPSRTQNPGSTLTIEEQEWDGLVERLTTALSSESETPDVVEIGNTQAPTFTSAGAFADLTDQLDDLGGDDLLPGFVDGATVDGETYAVPYYAGSKYVFYRKDLFEKAGLEVPTTIEEFVDAAIDLKKANPEPANFSGFWFPGQDWRNGVAFVWNAGGDLAVEDGGEWTGALSSPESVAGLETVAEALHRGVRRGQGRQRGRPVDAVLRRRDRHDVGARLGDGPHRGPGDRLPRHASPSRSASSRCPGSDGDAGAGAARRLRHRGRGEVAEPGPGQGGRRADAQRRVPDDPGRERAHPGEERRSRRCSVTTSSPQATIAAASNAKLTPAAPGWARSRAPGSSRTCSSRSPRAATSPSWRPTADEQMNAQLNG